MNVFIIRSFFVIVVATIGFSDRAVAQNNRVSLIFTEGGTAKKIENLKVEILSPSKGEEVLFSFESEDNKVMVNPKLKSLRAFDVRLSFDQFRLLLPNLGAKYFDNEWVIDIGEKLPKTKRNLKEMKRLGCDVLRIFWVDFKPSDREAVWWLLTGCEQTGVSRNGMRVSMQKAKLAEGR